VLLSSLPAYGKRSLRAEPVSEGLKAANALMWGSGPLFTQVPRETV
jgi:hypothetical protein